MIKLKGNGHDYTEIDVKKFIAFLKRHEEIMPFSPIYMSIDIFGVEEFTEKEMKEDGSHC